MLHELPTARYEFEGVDGEIHSFGGCSLAGLIEFRQRQVEMQRLLAEVALGEGTLLGLYLEDRRFRWLCDRQLQLNGIDPAWVNWSQVEQLLLWREVGAGEFLPGLLVELATPEVAKPSQEDKPANLVDFVAAMAPLCGGVAVALGLANSMPWADFLGLMTALAEGQKSPEQHEKDKFAAWAAAKRAAAEAAHG
jgi:hypothetical protein